MGFVSRCLNAPKNIIYNPNNDIHRSPIKVKIVDELLLFCSPHKIAKINIDIIGIPIRKKIEPNLPVVPPNFPNKIIIIGKTNNAIPPTFTGNCPLIIKEMITAITLIIAGILLHVFKVSPGIGTLAVLAGVIIGTALGILGVIGVVSRLMR